MLELLSITKNISFKVIIIFIGIIVINIIGFCKFKFGYFLNSKSVLMTVYTRKT